MRTRDVLFWALLLCASCAARGLPSNRRRDLTGNISPTPAYVANLGLTSDPAFNPNVRRDGGGGGYVNGHHIIGFSDTITVNNGQHGALRDFDSFVHNSFAYMGYRQQTSPTDLYDFGTGASSGAGTFPSPVVKPLADNETDTGGRFAIWSTGNYVASEDDKQAIGVMNCIPVGVSTPQNLENEAYYNTLVAIDVVDPSQVPDGSTLSSQRLMPQLFYGNGIMYGSFGLYKGPDSYLYLLEKDTASTPSGLYVARVPFSSMTDRSRYTFWNGMAWGPTPPPKGDKTSHILSFTNPGNPSLTISTGDLFYSPHFDRLITTFQDTGLDGQFWLAYSLTGSIIGPWSTPQTFYTPPVGSEPCDGQLWSNWNYAGHAYPEWDGSGETLLLSWSSCSAWVKMGLVQWA